MDAQVVEAGDQQDRDGEGPTSNADLWGVPSACKRGCHDGCARQVIKVVVGVSKARVGVGLIGLKTELMKLSLLLFT